MSAYHAETDRPRPQETPICTIPEVPDRTFGPEVDPFRARFIVVSDKVWANGTVLHYHFMESPAAFRGAEDQKQAVRDAFDTWKTLGIGLAFEEVTRREEAEIRIGFLQGDGAWSYVGRDVVDIATSPDQRTMNFGWDLTTPWGRETALHEIGHTLGLPHEHQNPNAGIVWNEDAVIARFSGPPNNWSQQQIHWNILRKIPANTVHGSAWDPNSIMHYPFEAGLIQVPEEFRTTPLAPEPGLSAKDIEWVRKVYPPLAPTLPELKPFESQRLTIGPGEQVDFRLRPAVSRPYTIQTFGVSDVVMVLFEMIGDQPRYVDGDDDSGYDRNARLTLRLTHDREYVLRIRLYYANRSGETAVFMW